MNRALIIAGGPWQRDLLVFLKKRGYQTTVVNPYQTETTDQADDWIPADIRDLIQIKAFLRKARRKYSLVLTDQSDIAVPTATTIAHEMDLKVANGPEVIRRFTNKGDMYNFAVKLGLRVPKFRIVKSLFEAIKESQQLKFPLISKPADNHSSRGVRVVNYPEGLKEAFQESIEHAKSQEIILQELVRGTEVTVEGFCTRGKHRTLTTSRKQHFRPGIASSLYWPSKLSYAELSQVFKMNDDFIEEAGLTHGLTHAEYMIDEYSRAWLIEVAARGGGSSISSQIVPWVTGINTYDLWIRGLEGGQVTRDELIPQIRREALLQFYEFTSGSRKAKVQELKGTEEVQKLPTVKTVRWNLKIGDSVEEAHSDSDRHAMVVFMGDTQSQIEEDEKKAKDLLSVRFKL